MPTTEEYDQINTCLYQLAHLLKRIGISQFNVQADKRYVEWDTNQEIDQVLLNEFCKNISTLYVQLK